MKALALAGVFLSGLFAVFWAMLVGSRPLNQATQDGFRDFADANGVQGSDHDTPNKGGAQ